MSSDGASPCDAGSATGDASCASGFTGPTCEVCAEAWHYFDSAVCLPCASAGSSVGKVLGIAIGVALALGGLWWVINSSWLPTRATPQRAVKMVRRQAVMWRQVGTCRLGWQWNDPGLSA